METDFRKWATACGFNGKEVSKAGEAIGIGQTSARERNRGEKDLSYTERLAMAAYAAGLPAWTPETAAEIASVKRTVDFLREMLQVSPPVVSHSSENHIPAE